MSLSLTAKTHTHTIDNFWVITSQGARKQFVILIFVLWMTPAPLSDHLTPLPCLISLMSWLLHHPLIISASSQYMLPLLHFPSTITHPYASTPLLHPHDLPLTLPPHIFPHSSSSFGTPATPS
ncbi:hypothetical protein O181_031249 [Austropuccinia psidii MF-1]|uniref:Uncharacterized protein n=1 Tax=Austropuccinia psidii MF-1 TaxID=1389203 RepID=A0A9Q3CUH3_9BASI|nr:hypothetical protein [Austropuccinia psidii MF-1]